jgi:hypothetical protein
MVSASVLGPLVAALSDAYGRVPFLGARPQGFF